MNYYPLSISRFFLNSSIIHILRFHFLVTGLFTSNYIVLQNAALFFPFKTFGILFQCPNFILQLERPFVFKFKRINSDSIFWKNRAGNSCKSGDIFIFLFGNIFRGVFCYLWDLWQKNIRIWKEEEKRSFL